HICSRQSLTPLTRSSPSMPTHIQNLDQLSKLIFSDGCWRIVGNSASIPIPLASRCTITLADATGGRLCQHGCHRTTSQSTYHSAICLLSLPCSTASSSTGTGSETQTVWMSLPEKCWNYLCSSLVELITRPSPA